MRSTATTAEDNQHEHDEQDQRHVDFRRVNIKGEVRCDQRDEQHSGLNSETRQDRRAPLGESDCR